MYFNQQKQKSLQGNSCFFILCCYAQGAFFSFLILYSSETVSLLRPFARRAANTLRPLAVAIRSRNPCLFFLLRLEGWYVLFIVNLLFIIVYFQIGLQMYSFFLK